MRKDNSSLLHELEEERKTVQKKEIEISILQKENLQFKEIISNADEEREKLHKLITELQTKNRDLNYKLSSRIFRAA